MRLGVLLDTFDPARGGAEAHTDALMRRAVEKGDSVSLACLEGAPPPGVDTVLMGNVPRSRPARDRVFAENGVKALRDAGSDAVIAFRHALQCDVYLPHGGLVADAWAATAASRGGEGFFRRLSNRWSKKRAFFLEAERALLGGKEGPKVVAVSARLQSRIAALYPAARSRTVVIPNGVDSARFSAAPFQEGREAMRARLGVAEATVGLLVAHNALLKGIKTAIEAMARTEVTSITPPFHLVVVGKRVDPDLLRLATRLGVADRLHAAGPVDDVRPLYAAADLLVHPTWHDPCSLVCLEALAMGLPVITTPRNGVAELMGQKGGIVLEEPGNAEALAVATRVLSEPTLRAETSEDARYLAEKNRLATRLDQVLDVCRAAVER